MIIRAESPSDIEVEVIARLATKNDYAGINSYC